MKLHGSALERSFSFSYATYGSRYKKAAAVEMDPSAATCGIKCQSFAASSSSA